MVDIILTKVERSSCSSRNDAKNTGYVRASLSKRGTVTFSSSSSKEDDIGINDINYLINLKK